MAIKGSLSEAGLPDVLQLLSLGRKTGCLSVTDRASLGYIYFEQGRICYATIVNRRDRLGDILVKNRFDGATYPLGSIENRYDHADHADALLQRLGRSHQELPRPSEQIGRCSPSCASNARKKGCASIGS